MNPDYQKRSWQIIKKIYNLWFSSNIINFEYYRIKKKKIKKKNLIHPAYPFAHLQFQGCTNGRNAIRKRFK